MTADEFWKQTKRVGPCLEWQGVIDAEGYGRVKHEGFTWLAHRLAWILTGRSLPPGIFVCHTCDNRRCVDLLHLFPGTHQTNMQDARLKGRPPGRALGERASTAKVTAAQVLEIRRLAATTAVTQIELGQMFGLTHGTISKIVSRKYWKHV